MCWLADLFKKSPEISGVAKEKASNLFLRRIVLEGDGDNKGALACFEQAYSLNPNGDNYKESLDRLKAKIAQKPIPPVGKLYKNDFV